MSNRSHDRLTQSKHDLGHAQHALEASNFDWACFAAHQSAEKAIKALILSLGGEGWGHAATRLLRDLENRLTVPPRLIQAAQRLDKHYIPSRYPNGFDRGSPHEYYTAEEAQLAIEDAQSIYNFCHDALY